MSLGGEPFAGKFMGDRLALFRCSLGTRGCNGELRSFCFGFSGFPNLLLQSTL